MRRPGQYIIILLLLLSSMIAGAQNRNNLIATKKGLVLLIDLSSPKNDIDTILKRAAIKGMNIQRLKAGDFSKMEKDGWVLVKHQGNILQFNLPEKELKENPQETPFVITADIMKKGNSSPGYMDNANYGINRYSTTSVYELPSGLTRFILPGYLKCRRVFLSGGFNEWSTLKGLMTKTATGWVIDIKLQPGAWMYKFIADGGWLTDPNNLINLDDGAGNTNSVYYKYNYVFKLHGFPAAHKVIVTGSFNEWRDNELQFVKKGDTWECPLYLRDGMHTYRFVVDGAQIADPANPDKFKDADGISSSVLNIGETIIFKLNGHTDAHDVYVAGSFNRWEDGKIRMKKTADGWAIPIILPAGNYDYQFIVDGDWILDPANPVHDVEDKHINSFIAARANHTFKLKGHDYAKTVILSGTFNNWSESGYRMGLTGGDWGISLHLKPGKYLYKFIVDDNWILDPANKFWEQNAENTGNSVLWIEP